LKMFSVVLFRSFGNIPYDEARRTCNILSLAERRHELGKRFFKRIIKDKSNVLFYLLPAKRNVQLTTRLRCARYIQQFMHRLIVIKTLLFYLDSIISSDVILCILCIHDFSVCLFNPAFRGCQNPINGLYKDGNTVGLTSIIDGNFSSSVCVQMTMPV